ncbi:MAG: ribosome recycling factor [Bacillales bacterium]|jgi:ribosome recycling factor|nr:ribosome recycling factor [Bacillales bacterium]
MDFNIIKEKMQKTVSSFTEELGSIRTGRANATILDKIKVDYFGYPTALRDVAKVAVPDGRTITITPYETNVLKDIEKAINASGIGLNPNNNGTMIILSIPSLTEDRRKELAKQVSKLNEGAKVAIRNIRRDYMETSKKDKNTSEDQRKRDEKEIQKITDEYSKKIDDTSAVKEKEIMTV